MIKVTKKKEIANEEINYHKIKMQVKEIRMQKNQIKIPVLVSE